MTSCIGTMMYVVSVTAPRSWTSTRTVDPDGCSGDPPTHMTISAVLSTVPSGVELAVGDVGLAVVVASVSGAKELEQPAEPSTSRQPSTANGPLSHVVITA